MNMKSAITMKRKNYQVFGVLQNLFLSDIIQDQQLFKIG